MMLHDIVNAKPVAGAIHEFFGSSQLSQFMDQTNLYQKSHTSADSVHWVQALTRERAGLTFATYTLHYGRICPIETPEGQTSG